VRCPLLLLLAGLGFHSRVVAQRCPCDPPDRVVTGFLGSLRVEEGGLGLVGVEVLVPDQRPLATHFRFGTLAGPGMLMFLDAEAGPAVLLPVAEGVWAVGTAGLALEMLPFHGAAFGYGPSAGGGLLVRAPGFITRLTVSRRWLRRDHERFSMTLIAVGFAFPHGGGAIGAP